MTKSSLIFMGFQCTTFRSNILLSDAKIKVFLRHNFSTNFVISFFEKVKLKQKLGIFYKKIEAT